MSVRISLDVIGSIQANGCDSFELKNTNIKFDEKNMVEKIETYEIKCEKYEKMRNAKIIRKMQYEKYM